jgi:hypothetical protein
VKVPERRRVVETATRRRKRSPEILDGSYFLVGIGFLRGAFLPALATLVFFVVIFVVVGPMALLADASAPILPLLMVIRSDMLL